MYRHAHLTSLLEGLEGMFVDETSHSVLSASAEGGARSVDESLSVSRLVAIMEEDSSNKGCGNDPTIK